MRGYHQKNFGPNVHRKKTKPVGEHLEVCGSGFEVSVIDTYH